MTLYLHISRLPRCMTVTGNAAALRFVAGKPKNKG